MYVYKYIYIYSPYEWMDEQETLLLSCKKTRQHGHSQISKQNTYLRANLKGQTPSFSNATSSKLGTPNLALLVHKPNISGSFRCSALQGQTSSFSARGRHRSLLSHLGSRQSVSLSLRNIQCLVGKYWILLLVDSLADSLVEYHSYFLGKYDCPNIWLGWLVEYFKKPSTTTSMQTRCKRLRDGSAMDFLGSSHQKALKLDI